ncbi:hypothetical protein C0J52_20281 [Blattella germanica]|nr:hypothetical protein C0J52_20281 [Blattella germanica]
MLQRVVPRPAQSFSHELYVCHRNSFLSEITVRYAQPSDVPLAKEVIGFIKNNEEMNIDFKAAVTFEHCTLRAFVTLSGKDIVGVAIVMPQEEMLYLHTHYDIKAFADLKLHNTDCHGILKHFTVSPIFNCHIRFFLSEILRLSEYTSLYYLHHHITTEQYKVGLPKTLFFSDYSDFGINFTIFYCLHGGTNYLFLMNSTINVIYIHPFSGLVT